MIEYAAPMAQTGPIVIDFVPLANALVDALVTGLKHLFSPLPIDAEKWMLTSIQSLLSAQGAHNLLTHIPTEDTTASGDVLDLWRQGLAAQVALAALVIVINGYRVMRGSVDIWEVLFKTGFLILAGESVIFWSFLIFTAINSLSDAVGATKLDIREETLPNDLTMGMTLIIALVLELFAWIKGAVGVVFIKVLLVSAPYLFTISAIPMLDGLARWWAEEFTTWTLRAFMVALVLRLGLGVAIENTGGLQFLFAIVSFWLAYTMDTRIRRFSVGAWGQLNNANLLMRGAKLVERAFS